MKNYEGPCGVFIMRIGKQHSNFVFTLETTNRKKKIIIIIMQVLKNDGDWNKNSGE